MDGQSRLALLTDVRREIQALEKELDELRRVESYLAKTPTPVSPPPTPPTPPVQLSPESPPVSHARRFSSVTSIAEAVAAILKESGRPMRSGEIAEIMTAGGYPAKGDERGFSNTVFSAIRRREDLFEKRGRGLFGLRALPNGVHESPS